MENYKELYPEMEELKQQFKLLTEKVERQEIVTKQLIKEVEKKKIRKYEFWNRELWGILFFIICMLLILDMYSDGYPLWAYLSIPYMSIILIVINFVAYKLNKKYLETIGYSIIKYTEDLSKQSNNSLKSFFITIVLLMPVFIHFVCLTKYMIMTDKLPYNTNSYWLISASVIILAIVTSIVLRKVLKRVTLRCLR